MFVYTTSIHLYTILDERCEVKSGTYVVSPNNYLISSPHPVYIRSDHKNLTYFRTAKKLNRRQARWSLFLSEFDIKLEHIPGNKMVISDTLSQHPDLCQDENNNNNMTLLPDTLFVGTIDLVLGYVICHLSVLVTDVGLLSHHGLTLGGLTLGIRMILR